MDDELMDFLSFYGMDVVEERLVSNERINGIGLTGRITSVYTIQMRGTEGLERLLERLMTAENTRRTLTEIIRARVI